ncbi:MAG: YkgJ family cysteine cluster protein [Myxococcota bacterium]|jgi:Fe-S-cluster containining protein|nr:YkgJ family cysteine cluster protein [Myxococcota bacterium]
MSSWFDETDGLRFECTQCGACCKNPGVILFTPQDILRVSTFLNFTPEAFKARYLKFYDAGQWSIDVGPQQPCVFLDEEDRCSIQEVKPWQCSAYPFWYEIVDDMEGWFAEKERCEGIGQGKKHSATEIRDWLAQDALVVALMEATDPDKTDQE